MRFSWLKHAARLVGAFLMVALLGVFAPVTARAGCSHPVRSLSSLLDHAGRLDGLITGDLDQAPGTPWETPGQRKPCSGPGCSSKTPIPIPTASTGLEGMPHWGSLGSSFVLDEQRPTRRSCEPSDTLVAAPRSAIFHPPRG